MGRHISDVLTSSAASAAATNLAVRGEDGTGAEPGRPPFASEQERAEYLRGLVLTHFSNVWRFLMRLGFTEDIADDAAQDLYFVVARRLDDIVPGRERGFLFASALRIASALKRERARELPVDPQEATVEIPAPLKPAEERLDDERARELLYRLLSELDERFRVVFVLYELEEMTMQEISDALEVPPGTVASRLRSARDEFRAKLERHRARLRRESK
ncbi:RNA polymerase sigma factor [Labilithrix luteola]|uniref:RNA polymerase sigma factor n=1 Tax=Labilithrix luteola TaxID=1391654 RepID=UPI0011BAC719|nr:RNA polymerase sigma factor [Labilithrix luteola]